MVKQPVCFDELERVRVSGVNFDLKLPDFVDTDHMFIYTRTLSVASFLLSSNCLNIVTEAGETSRANYGMAMRDSDWSPGLGGVMTQRESVSTVRTVEEREAEETHEADWIILNSNELYEEIQDREFIPKFLLKTKTERKEYIDRPWSFSWAHVMDRALRTGLRELARKKAMRNPLMYAAATLVGASTMKRLVHSAGYTDEYDEYMAEQLSEEEYPTES